ncbi:MAG: hypothetical protein HYV09_28115 [Deltaproteobacteria bacterium]|nr:hypothetical protein [Deltaproteobacteria bacterium]
MIGPLTLVASLAFTLGGAASAPREVEFPFDDAQRLLPGETDAGKVWRSHGLPTDGRAVPLVVFVHGIIFDGKRHHWLTEDRNGPWDARPFMDSLVDSGEIAPLVVAVPSQTRDATDPSKLFVGLDFDAFVAAVDGALAPLQKVDRSRIVVIGHSGSACEPGRAAMAALDAKTFTPRALLAVDGCFAPSTAPLLARTERARDVIVTYQEQIWERPIAEFRARWSAELERAWPHGQRVLERFEPGGENPHLAIVEATARRWLPVLLPPVDGVAWPARARTSITAQLPSLPSPSMLL